MIHYEQKMASMQVLTSYECDKCEAVYEVNGSYDDCVEAQEFLCIDLTGGYASIFGDMARIQCDLCQSCLKELLGPYLRLERNDE